MGILRRHQDGVAEGFTDVESVVSSAPTTVTPLEIQQKEFGVSRFGGYKMRDVDVFLDQLTDVVSTLMAENERLREGGSGAHVAIGEPELGDVRRQADEMIARAREEAAKIVADAHVQAMSVGSSLASGDDRAAIDAFLAQERAFLQGLGRLVQDHAESVKGMAKTARRRPVTRPPVREATAVGGSTRDASDQKEGKTEAPTVHKPDAEARTSPEPPSPPSSPARPEAPSAPRPARVEPVSASPAPLEPSPPAQRPPEPMPDVEAERTKAPPVPAPPDTIRIEDPEPAVSSRRDSEDAPRREGTLRELFWGEEN